jgi:Eukaryotic cytochrome b561
MMQWLLSPMSGAQDHTIATLLAWHARNMVLAWGVLIPVAILVARYWKIWPGQNWPQELDNKTWWNLHRALHSVALLLITLGAVLAIRHRGDSALPSSLHSLLGWSLVLIAWLQALGGLLRGSKGGPTEPQLRGDHFDMSMRRQQFERIHKALGWLSLPLAIVTIMLGLTSTDAPRWMPLSLLCWWLALAGLAWRWQKAHQCIDTYQAIWGIDSHLPGLSKKPIGWGIQRIDTITRRSP